jgi:hypothetical protein
LYKNALITADETYLVQIVIRQKYDNFVKDTDYAMGDKNTIDYEKELKKEFTAESTLKR